METIGRSLYPILNESGLTKKKKKKKRKKKIEYIGPFLDISNTGKQVRF